MLVRTCVLYSVCVCAHLNACRLEGAKYQQRMHYSVCVRANSNTCQLEGVEYQQRMQYSVCMLTLMLASLRVRSTSSMSATPCRSQRCGMRQAFPELSYSCTPDWSIHPLAYCLHWHQWMTCAPQLKQTLLAHPCSHLACVKSGSASQSIPQSWPPAIKAPAWQCGI